MNGRDVVFYGVLLGLSIGFIAFMISCASPPDMSRREAIAITNLTKELTKNEHP